MAGGAGKLDRKIVIERYTSGSVDAFGEDTAGSWDTFITVSAGRKDASDGEKVSAGQINAVRMSRFVIRSSVNARSVLPTDRVSYDNKIWDIHGIKETSEGRMKYLELTVMAQAD
jgi:head-tail adaptor